MSLGRSSLWRERPHGFEWLDAIDFLICALTALVGLCVVSYLVLAHVIAQRQWPEAIALVSSILLVVGFVVRDIKRKRVGLVSAVLIALWLGLTVCTALGY